MFAQDIAAIAIQGERRRGALVEGGEERERGAPVEGGGKKEGPFPRIESAPDRQ